MYNAARSTSLIALLATVVPSLLYLGGIASHDMVKWLALLGTIIWFVATPLWMGREPDIDASEVEI